MRADLEYWSSLWFWILVASTALVVIGIIGEAPEVLEAVGFGDKTTGRIRRFWYARIRRVEFCGWEKVCPELTERNPRHRKWIAKIALISWALIAVGVAGEGVAEYFVNDVETDIKAFDNAELIETQGSANSAAEASSLAFAFSDKSEKASSNAIALATEAQRELARAEADASKAQMAALNALTTATDAGARAGKAEASLGEAEAEAKGAESSASNALRLASEARKVAASFESDLARLKKQAEDRVLDEYQQDEVSGKVGPFLGTPYELAVADTPEAEKLLSEIDAAVSSAGWLYKVSENKAFRFTKLLHGRKVEQISGVKGVEIGVSFAVGAKLKPAAEALNKALNSQGISTLAVKLADDDPSPNNIHISVGTKP